MVYQTDNQIKMVLGINAWRNLLNDKIVRFAQMMPQMKPDVMIDIIRQLPQFWHYAKGTLSRMESDARQALTPQQAEQFIDISRFLDRDFDSRHNSDAEKIRYTDAILSFGDDLLDADWLDDKGRKFILEMREHVTCDTRTLLIAILTYIGGRQGV